MRKEVGNRDACSLGVVLAASRGEDPVQVMFLVHKTTLGHMPDYIVDLLTSVADIAAWSSLRASRCSDLNEPRTCRRVDNRAFSFAASQVWNRLPTELKQL